MKKLEIMPLHRSCWTGSVNDKMPPSAAPPLLVPTHAGNKPCWKSAPPRVPARSQRCWICTWRSIGHGASTPTTKSDFLGRSWHIAPTKRSTVTLIHHPFRQFWVVTEPRPIHSMSGPKYSEITPSNRVSFCLHTKSLLLNSRRHRKRFDLHLRRLEV